MLYTDTLSLKLPQYTDPADIADINYNMLILDKAAIIDNNINITGRWAFSSITNTGLNILDTDGSNTLGIVPGENLTTNRTLSIIVGDSNRTLTLNGNLTVGGNVSFTNGVLQMSNGGTSANLTASNGGIVYSTDTSLSVLAGTNTANKVLMSGASAAPSWSTPTYPNTATAGKILIGNGTDIVLTTAGYPSQAGTSGNVLMSDGTNIVSQPQSNISHSSLSNLSNNDHTQYVNAVGGAPLTLTSQSITFNYDTADFQLSGNNLQVKDSGIDHNSLYNYSSNRHIDHTAVSISAGTGLSGGGTIDVDRTISLSHLGIESLSDPNADRIMFWDDSESAVKWLTVGTGLTIIDTTITATGATDHSALSNLDYAHAGHTGFEPTISVLELSRGGTGKGLTAANGGIVYTDADSMEILSPTTTANKVLMSGASAAPSWSTATYPNTAGSSGNVIVSNGTNFESVAQSNIDHGSVGGLSDDDHTQYLLANGTRSLTGNWDVGDGRTISTEKISARDSDGLTLTEDGGKGILIQDNTGYVGINKSNPSYQLDVNGDIYTTGKVYLGADWKKALTASEGTKEIYVATTGSDETGDGSASKPYKTISKAVSVLPRCITEHTYINISPGTYNLGTDGYVDTIGIDVWASLTFRAKNTDGYELYPSSPLQANIYSSNTIGNSSLSLQPNSLVDGKVWIMNGTGAGQYRTIVSNTATTITVGTAWDTTPDSTSYFLYCGGVNIQGSSDLMRLISGEISLFGVILKSTGGYAVCAYSAPACHIWFCFFNECRRSIITARYNILDFRYNYLLQPNDSLSGLIVQSFANVYIYGSIFNGQSTSYNTAGIYCSLPGMLVFPPSGTSIKATFTNLRYGVYAPDFDVIINKDVNVTFTNVTTPYYMGKGDFRTALISDDSSNAILEIKNNSSTSDYDQQIKFTKASTTSFSIGVDDSDSDKFKISAGSALGTNDRLVIDTAGNVGIGTTTPGYTIDVSGSARITGTLVLGSGTGVLKVSSGTVSVSSSIDIDNIGITIDGAGSVITTGSKGYRTVDYNCTILGWTILADQVGSCVIDVRKCTYDAFPSTTSISGSEKPTLSSAQKNRDMELNTWTTSISAGDILEFVVNSASTVTRVTVLLKVRVS